MPTVSSQIKSDASPKRPLAAKNTDPRNRIAPRPLSPATAVVDRYSLSPLQQGMLYHALAEPNSGVDIEQMVITLHEPVDPARLKNAWERVVARHPILRTSFQWEGVQGEPQQQVWSAVEVTLATLDLSHQFSEAGAAAFEKWLREDRRLGFEMDHPPLMRWALIRIDAKCSKLVWTFHHALLDGRSFPLLLNEVFQAYDQPQSAEPPAPRLYREFIAWQRGLDETRSETFWRETLKGFTAPTHLPIIEPSADTEKIQGSAEIKLAQETTQKLAALAKDHGVTMNTVVQGAWALLLSRYSREEDVLFGATRACRHSTIEGADQIPGLFINTVPVRTQVSPEANLIPWLQELRRFWVDVRAHEHTPLTRVQAWSDIRHGAALFNTLLVFENYDLNTVFRAQGGAWAKREIQLHELTNFPICLAAYAGEQLRFVAEYDRSQITEASIQGMLGHLARLLESMAENPETTLGKLSLLTSAERLALLAAGVPKGEPVPVLALSDTIQARFETQAALRPDSIAASCDDQSLTYAELNSKANQLAHFLRSNGVAPDTLVGVCTERSLDLLVALLGILKAGAAYLPIDLAYPAERLAFMLQDAKAPFLLTQSHLVKDLPQHSAQVLCLDDPSLPLWSGPSSNPEPSSNADHLAYVIYTSGSTGKPKGVQISHRNVLRLFEATQRWFHFDHQDVWSLFHSYAFDFSVWEIWGALLYGGRVVVVPFAISRSPQEFYRLVAKEKVTVLNQTPSAFRQFSAAEEAAPLPLSLRLIIFGGEALEMSSLKAWFARHGDQAPKLINMYGITETTVHVTYRPLGKEDLSRASLIGEPIADLQLHVLDERMEPSPIGVPGEMFVGGAGLARGYLNRAELTAQRFIPDPFSKEHGARLYRTGDLARRLANGDIEYLGRIDHQVQLRGFRVELGEIETVLLDHPGVREAKVIMREDTPGDQRLAAYLIARNGSLPPISELREHLRKKLPDYMVPAVFVGLEQFPLTNNGKLDTKALPMPSTERAALGSSYAEPQSELEKTLAKIWQEVLKTPRVGLNDNFFELGGDSILGIQIISRARAAGLDLMPRHLFKNQTIAELAAVCGNGASVSIPAPAKLAPTTDIPLTPIQKWFFDHRFTDPNHWTQSFLFETRAPLDAEKLRAALVAVVANHGSLRIRFDGTRQSMATVETADLLQVIRGAQVDTLTPQTQLDIVRGPLLRAVLWPDAHRFFLTVHHLAVDGVSWRILLEDLEAAYQGRSLAATTASFADWSQSLREYAASPQLRGEAAYWRSVLLHAPEEPALPCDVTSLGANRESSVEPLTVSLSEQETQALLRDVPAAFGTRINAALLTALATAFRDRTGRRSLFLDLEGHGREHAVSDMDTTRTVGWFTSMFPVALQLPLGDDLAIALASVQKQLSAIPDHGVGYGVLRHLSEGSLLAAEGHAPDLVFNHLGQFDQVTDGLELLRFASEPTAPWHGGANQRTHALEINTLVVGGRLEIRISSSRNLHRRETISALADAFVAKLRALIALAKPQASSLPLSPMQQLFFTLGSSKPNYPYDQWHSRLEGPLNLPLFEEAWEHVIQRHSILRSTFSSDGKQMVHEHVAASWTIKDATPEEIPALLEADKRTRNDLAQVPLSRFQILRFSDTDHFFLWSLPDLQMDGWSWPVLFREVSLTYAALMQGQEPALPPARPYSDYLDWLAANDQADSQKFWKQNLAGFKNPTPLPLDLALSRSSSRRFAEQMLSLSSEATATLKSAARQRRLTAGVIVQAAWAALLSRCAPTDDVVFGAAFSGRPADLRGAGSIIGPFTNNLPVRLRVNATAKTGDFLAAVQDHLFELDAHQFTSPLEIQDASEVAWKDRLFDSLVVFQNYEVSDEATRLGHDVHLRDFAGPIHTNFDLTLIAEPGEALCFTLIHDENRCSSIRAQALLSDLSAIVAALVERSEASVADIQSVVSTSTVAVAPIAPVVSANYITPTTALQRQIAGVWQKAFGVGRIGIEDNFFDLGGHSLLLVRVHAKLREVLNRDFPIVTLFQHPTIASLARQFESKIENHDATVPISTTPENRAVTDIAIVGMAIRAPGADTLDQFWRNLVEECETITTFAKSEIVPGEPADDPDYIPRRGILKSATFLDANFFGIKPKEAEVIDPQQRLFLEAAHEALESAGVYPREWPGSIGVYAGVGKNYYYLTNVHHNHELRELVGDEAVNEGTEKDYIAPRVAYKLDLTGPALNIHTACSTSLVAVCQAVRAILDGDCDMALAGGASIRYPQERGYLFEEGSIQSRDGHCRAFDAASSGTVFSNGVGVVVLKRLDQAQRDGDTIYALIKGVGLNNDGAGKVSFTAPSVDGQAGAIEKALRMAGVSPETISYVEAHGTGTPLGDPIEVAGLTKAFRALGTTRKNFCGLGSLKPSTGHLDAAAGVCGLIKATLAMHHRQIPATLHFTKPNPKLGLEDTPFRVIDRLTDWVSKSGDPRRAGVSALGVGGTNAHVILEEAPSAPASAASTAPQLLVLATKTETALTTARENLAAYLEAHPETNLTDAAFTLQVGRQPHAFRTALVASSTAEAVVQLRGKAVVKQQSARDLPVAMLFPGQGAQYPGMGEGLYAKEAIYRETVDHCAEILEPVLGLDLRSLLYPESSQRAAARESLKETRFTQPAIFVTSYAMAQVWRSWGITPSIMLGHSVGEYVAATLAGVFRLEDALVLVAKRAQLVQALAAGAMLAVRLPEEEVAPLLPVDLDLAALNSKNLTVVSGSIEATERFEASLKERGIVAKRLATSHAFHSRMMEPAIEPFKALFKDITLQAPAIPVVSNVTGRLVTAEEAIDPAYWAAHIRQAVRFTDGLATLFSESPAAVLEVGPGTSSATFARQHPARGQDRTVVSTLSSPEADEQASMLDALGKLWLGGVTIPWSKFYSSRNEQRRRIALPTYPFERQNYCAPALMAVPLQRPFEPATSATPEPLSVPAVAAAVATPSISRLETITAELKNQLHELSGTAISDLHDSATFLDLGFDSLFLTQASLVLKKHFGVKITFRQLMENLNSIGALAAHLDATLPPDRFAPVAVATIAPVVATAPRASSLEQRIAALEAAVSRLANGSTAPAASAPTPAKASSSVIKVQNQNSNPNKKMSFGPFRQIEKAAAGSLTPVQDTHLKKLIADYNTRTGGSKAHTQKYRRVLADPRAVAGFNPLWKDLIYPIVANRSEGSKIWDVDDNEYVDVTLGFGLSLFGHRPKFVQDAVKEQLDRGIEIGPSHPLAGEVAEMLLEFSGMDRVSFCDTGSEAVTAAIRISRTVSGRDKIVMFTGAYHGIFDEVLVRPLVVNGELRSAPIAPGITNAAVQEIIVLEYGNPESLEILRRHGHDIAAVLVETIQSRRPDYVPVEFLKELRAITKETETALVFDEVVTGFRAGPGGNQERFGIRADIVTYGKVVGGGLPIGVVSGIKKYMDALDGGFWQYGDASFPEVGVTFFAGTFVRHPLALAAAKAVLTHLKQEGPALQQNLEARAERLVADLNTAADRAGVPILVTRFSSMYFFNFAPELKHASLFFVHMRMRGIHMWETRPSFISTAHTDEDLRRIVDAFSETLAALQSGGFFPKAPIDGAPDESTAFPLTGPQEELFLTSQLSEGANLACNESVTLQLRGPISIEKLKTALQALVDRHEHLRTTFMSDGTVQRITPKLTLQMVVKDPQEEKVQPFDLTHGPLVRATIVKISETEHQVILASHHIVCDGWSFDLMARDLAALYNGDALPAPTPFRVYAAEQQAFLSSPEFAENEKYWLDQFATLPEAFELPADFKRPAQKSYRSGVVHERFSPELSAKLRAFCKTNGLTPYAVLLSAYHLLLAKLSGQKEIVIGAPIAGQAASGHENLCGQCVNFLPMRLNIAEGATLLDHFKRTRSLVLDTLEHQNYTLGHLTRRLQYGRDAARPQFVNVTFTLEPEGQPRAFGAAKATAAVSNKSHFAFDHGLFVVDSAEAFKLHAIFSRDLFTDETAQRWLVHFTTLVEGLISRPSSDLVSNLLLLGSAERSALLAAAVPKGEPVPALALSDTIQARFEKQAVLRPEAIAATCDDQSLTYAELNSKANQLAHFLRSNGVAPDTLVGVCTERSLDLLVALLGILKAGAAYLPIDLAYPAERLAFMLQDAKAPFLLTQSHLVKDLPQHSAQVLCLDDRSLPLWSGPSSNPEPSSNADHLAYVIYTSGSTGKPKGVQISHRNVLRLFEATQRWFHFDHQDVWSLFHSYAFDFSVWEIWGALLYGGRVVVVPFAISRSPQEFYRLVAKEKVTVLNQTPSAFKQFSAVEEAAPLPLNLRLVIFGGEALEMSSLKAWFARHGDQTPKLINMYGITETTVHVTYRPLGKEDLGRASLIGEPIADLQLHVLDQRMEPSPVGVPGEMFVGGAGLARGYLNRGELTAQRFIPDPFSNAQGARLYRTGDLARRLANGDIEYLGRIDHQVQLRGFRVELGEIETVLLDHPAVREAKVIMREDTPGDQRLAAYLIARNGSLPPIGELREHLRKKLPDYMVPAAFVGLEQFPLTNNGKLDTKALPMPSTERLALGSSYAEPQSELEKTLAKIWQDVLKTPRVGLHDNFFELGGHSLLGLALFTRIQNELGVALPLATLFQTPTVGDLARVIESLRAPTSEEKRPEAPVLNAITSPTSILALVQPDGSKTPLFCIHGGDGGSLFYRQLAMDLPHDRRFYAIEAPSLTNHSQSLDEISVESCAQQYLKEIKKVQPAGPYLLGGYSFGGVVAWEIARRLRQNGEKVLAVVLFDTSNPQVELKNRYNLPQRIAAHWRLHQHLPAASRISSLVSRFAKGLVSKRQHFATVHAAEAALKEGSSVSDETRVIQVREANNRAFESYAPRALDAPVILLRANTDSDLCFYSDELGWEGLTPAGIKALPITGAHLEIFKVPHLSVMVQQLTDSLGELP